MNFTKDQRVSSPLIFELAVDERERRLQHRWERKRAQCDSEAVGQREERLRKRRMRDFDTLARSVKGYKVQSFIISAPEGIDMYTQRKITCKIEQRLHIYRTIHYQFEKVFLNMILFG